MVAAAVDPLWSDLRLDSSDVFTDGVTKECGAAVPFFIHGSY
jgi:hypothetical protein